MAAYASLVTGRSGGHIQHGAQTKNELTFQPGHLMGAGQAVFQTTQNVGYTYGTALTFKMDFFHFNAGHNLGNFRFSVTTDDRSTYADGLSTNGNVAATWTVLHPSSATTDGSLKIGRAHV